MIKAIIFDLDGVLVDTKQIHFEALNAALKKFKFKEISNLGSRVSRYKHSAILVIVIIIKPTPQK